ncbi:ANTAR domain-containing response regulator [Methylobacterium aquaticum]|uniref:ANTAR domain-containing response regulator n=1 Tax=Methylobacterium aquaticum TaxID=270351 RepID=UPI0019336BFC|nr:ANTAR domain-containing protein [Methylobacterium aquaticum]QRE75258.1 ANTAR domain-containing protein [Methylobacterium aquaticum]
MSAPARKILDELRRARVLVVHPRDEEGASLIDQLRRLGCEVSQAWPPPAALPPETDTLFVLLDDADVRPLLPAIEEAGPTVVAIVGYESPTSLKAIVDVNAHGVLAKPLRARGVLTQFALARYRRGYEGRLTSKITRLEETMKGRRSVEKAVRLLVDLNRIDEDAAYRLLRDRATAARVPMASVAESVVAAHEAMSGLGLRIALAEKT